MENQKIRNFSDLLAWQEAHRCALKVYEVTRAFPKDEMFGLVSQMRRAAVSITSNIAEGFGRKTSPDKRQFYNVAGVSIAEIQSQLFLARDLGYLDEATHELLFQMTESAYRLLNGLISYIS